MKRLFAITLLFVFVCAGRAQTNATGLRVSPNGSVAAPGNFPNFFDTNAAAIEKSQTNRWGGIPATTTSAVSTGAVVAVTGAATGSVRLTAATNTITITLSSDSTNSINALAQAIVNAFAGSNTTALAGKQATLNPLGTSNATVKVLLNGSTNLLSLEAGANVTLSLTATSIVVTAAGGSTSTNEIVSGGVLFTNGAASLVAGNPTAILAVTDSGRVSTNITERIIPASWLWDHSITHDELAANSVEEDNINDDSITQSKIQGGAVDTDEINDEAVTTDKMSGSYYSGSLAVTVGGSARILVFVRGVLTENNDP